MQSQVAELAKYIKDSYGDEPEFLWEDFENAIWRNSRNKKWYAIVQEPPRNRLGLDGDEKINIVNIRLAPERVIELVDGKNFFPAYHMNKKYWLTIRLDDTIDFKTICDLVDESYQNIDAKK